MANELLNPVVIGKELLVRLENNLVMAKMVNREFEDKFAVPNDKCGYTFNARVPVRMRGTVGDAFNPEDIRETMVPITINRLWGAHMDVSDQDLTLTIDRFGERYLESASQTIANKIDGEGCDLAGDVYNQVGTPGTIPTSLSTYTDAGVVLADSACPESETQRAIVLNAKMQAAVLGFASNIFNPAKTISEQYLTGKMGIAVGFRFNMDQNVARHKVGALGTAGAITSNPVVNGANQTGDQLVTDGWDASIKVLNKNDIITVAGCDAVNPLSYRDNGSLRTFRVTEDVTSDVGGNATIPIDPPIDVDTTSPFQTVTDSPADNAIIYVFGIGQANFANIAGKSSPQALAFHRDAFTLAIVKQELPGGMEWAEQLSDPKSGLALRLVRGYDLRSNRKLTRVEVLGGWKTIRPEFACRVCG
ncbi:MAG: hypothetical protein M1541_04965 [Acidobacteria bacterium]|nr:hypothetical protein [Acidobacteriota bacterium]